MRNVMVMAIFLSCVFASNSFGAGGPVDKAKRGIISVVTAPIEIPKEIRAHWIKGSEKTYHVGVWILCGFVKGTVMMTARIGSGVWDVVTFPIKTPKNYEPLLKPDYVFDQWPQRQEGVVYKQLGEK